MWRKLLFLLAFCLRLALNENIYSLNATSNLQNIPPSAIPAFLFNNTFQPLTTSFTLTLGVVLSNPNMTEAMIRQVLTAVENRLDNAPLPSFYSPFFNQHQQQQNAFIAGRVHVNYKLQINPVNTYNQGLNRLLKNLFCSRSAQGMNAIFVLMDKSSVRNNHGAQLTNMLAMLASHIGMPMLAWSSSASDLRQPQISVADHQPHYYGGNTTSNNMTAAAFSPTGSLDSTVIVGGNNSTMMDTLLLTPSIKSQARAIYAFLKQFHGDRKVTVIASTRTPGCELFITEIRSVSDAEDKRFSLFEFDAHQFHQSSRIIQILKIDQTNIDYLSRELSSIRDHTETRAFIVFANQFDSDKVFEEAHHLGMTSSDFLWVLGKPALGDLGESSPIPPNYVPGIVAVTYNTSLNAQLVALKTAVQVWSEGIKKFLHLSKANSILTAQQQQQQQQQRQFGPFYYHHQKAAANLIQQQLQTLAPLISCNSSAQIKWQNGQLLHRAMKHRLAKFFGANSSDQGLQGLSDIIYLDLQFNRTWKAIGSWTTLTNLAQIDDSKWLSDRDKSRDETSNNHRRNVIRVATLEEPPYVVYEFPDQTTGECDRKAIPCRLSPLAYVKPPDTSDDAHRHVHIITTANEDHDHHKNGSLMCCVGYSMDILRRLSHDIGFNFELFEVRDRKWGAVDKRTGQWNGLVQALLDGNADMVVTSLKINSDRSSVIEFSVPFLETGITILVRVREGMVSAVAFLEPFSNETWFVIFFGCVNVFALLTFTYEYLYHRYTILTKDHDETNRFSLVESFWIILSMLFNATGSIKQPQSTSTRFLTTLWSFICIILVASFMANLAAFMITKDDYYDFTGVDDYRLKNPYTKNPAWRYATIPSGATETIIRSNFPDMYEYMRAFMRPNADSGVDAVRKGELDAFIYDASVLEYKVGRDKNCALRTVGKWYALTGYGIALPKNSKWLHSVNKYIVDYQRSGYLQHLEEYWLASACKERQKSDLRRSHALGILNLKAVFAILLSCIAGCAIFLVVEHVFMRHCRRHLRKIERCRGFLGTISPKMGAALSFKATVEQALKESRMRAGFGSKHTTPSHQSGIVKLHSAGGAMSLANLSHQLKLTGANNSINNSPLKMAAAKSPQTNNPLPPSGNKFVLMNSSLLSGDIMLNLR